MNQLRAGFAVSGAFLLGVLLGPLTAPSVHAQDAQRATPPPGKALLSIFRSDREPRAAQVPIAVNAVHVGDLEDGTFLSVSVDPGRTFLRSGDRVLGTLEFQTAPDQTYFVWVEAVHGLSLVQTEMRLVSEEEGRRALERTRAVTPADGGVIPLAPPSLGAAPPSPGPAPPSLEAAPLELPLTLAAEPVAAKPPDAMRGLYFRLDIGLSQSTGADIKDKDFAGSGIICGDANCTVPGKLKDVGVGAVLSGGIGYRFSSHVRADLILGFRGYVLNASDASVPATKFKAPVISSSAIAGCYYDFATAGWTPYVGAGVGFAANDIGTVTLDNGAGLNGAFSGGSKSGVAGAIMAGVGIPLSPGSALDIGYRFVSLGKLEIAAEGGYGGATGKLNAHELTLGLRF
jgi:opacity protein-like surface antigen